MSKNKRYFIGSFWITISLIFLLAGLCTVDYHTRRIGFGNDTPIAQLISLPTGRSVLQIHILGLDLDLPLPSTAKP